MTALARQSLPVEPECAYCNVRLDRFWWVDPDTGQRFCSVYHLSGGRFRGSL